MTVTGQIKEDTTHIVLPVEVARNVVVDLLEGDRAKDKVGVLEEKIVLQEEIIGTKDSLVTVLEKKFFVSQQSLENMQNTIQQDAILQERLRGRIKKNKAYAVGFGCSTLMLVALMVVNLLH